MSHQVSIGYPLVNIQKLWKDPPCYYTTGKLTIAIFNSYVTNYQRVLLVNHHLSEMATTGGVKKSQVVVHRWMSKLGTSAVFTVRSSNKKTGSTTWIAGRSAGSNGAGSILEGLTPQPFDISHLCKGWFLRWFVIGHTTKNPPSVRLASMASCVILQKIFLWTLLNFIIHVFLNWEHV